MYADLSTRELFKRFSSNTVLYGLSLVLTRAGWVLLLPLYWSALSPADYGIIGVAQLVQAVLVPVLSLGLHDSVQRLYHEWNADERPKHVAALWTASVSMSLVLCAVLDVLGAWLAPYLFVQVPYEPYLRLALWSAFFVNLALFSLALLRIREDIKVFSLLTIVAFAGQAALTLYFVLGRGMGPYGFLLGTLINAALIGIAHLIVVLRECRFRFRRAHLTGPLRYGLPTVPTAILDGTASLFDRYFLDKYIPLNQLGLYNLGNQFGSAFNLFNQVLKTSWLPFIYRVVSERQDGPEILSRFGVYYLALLTFPALGVALLSKELIALIGEPRFFGVYEFVPAFVLIYYIQSIAAAMGRGMDLAKKTAMWPIVPIVAILTSVAALSILVPKGGAYGALVALAIAACVRVFVQVGISMYHYPRALLLGTLAKVWVIALVAFFVGYQAQFANLWLNAFIKLALIMLAAAAILRLTVGRQAFESLLRLRNWRYS
jgi:O-antigen/teichoic acid export membrane protein